MQGCVQLQAAAVMPLSSINRTKSSHYTEQIHASVWSQPAVTPFKCLKSAGSSTNMFLLIYIYATFDIQRTDTRHSHADTHLVNACVHVQWANPVNQPCLFLLAVISISRTMCNYCLALCTRL